MKTCQCGCQKTGVCTCEKSCACPPSCTCGCQSSGDLAKQAFDFVQSKLSKAFSPKIGLILGSGLMSLADQIEPVAVIPYSDLKGFFQSTVSGHAGSLILGKLKGVDVVCLNGRVHHYEGATPAQLKAPIRLLKHLGCETLLITNAAGGINPDYVPGGVVMVSDQINFSFVNPLLGPNDDAYGVRFPSMENAFDLSLRQLFHQKAESLGMDLPEGIYIGVSGPSYETPAEVRMYRQLGADLVGMSTVNEVIIARHAGLKVVVLSAIANLAVGMTDEIVTHQEVLKYGKVAAGALEKLMTAVIPEI